MDIVRVLKQEETDLQKKLTTVRSAIAALNGSPNGHHHNSVTQPRLKSKMSAAGRARIAAATKARWKKFRAEKAKAGVKN